MHAADAGFGAPICDPSGVDHRQRRSGLEHFACGSGRNSLVLSAEHHDPHNSRNHQGSGPDLGGNGETAPETVGAFQSEIRQSEIRRRVRRRQRSGPLRLRRRLLRRRIFHGGRGRFLHDRFLLGWLHLDGLRLRTPLLDGLGLGPRLDFRFSFLVRRGFRRTLSNGGGDFFFRFLGLGLATLAVDEARIGPPGNAFWIGFHDDRSPLRPTLFATAFFELLCFFRLLLLDLLFFDRRAQHHHRPERQSVRARNLYIDVRGHCRGKDLKRLAPPRRDSVQSQRQRLRDQIRNRLGFGLRLFLRRVLNQSGGGRRDGFRRGTGERRPWRNRLGLRRRRRNRRWLWSFDRALNHFLHWLLDWRRRSAG